MGAVNINKHSGKNTCPPTFSSIRAFVGINAVELEAGTLIWDIVPDEVRLGRPAIKEIGFDSDGEDAGLVEFHEEPEGFISELLDGGAVFPAEGH